MKKAPATQPQSVVTDEKSVSEQSSMIAPNSTVTITIKADVADAAYHKTIKKLATKVKLPGFRQGKVPANIASEQLNPEYVIEKALQLVLPEAYEAAIKESGKKPLSYPEFKALSVDHGKDWQVEAQFAEEPTVTLKDYKKLVSSTHKEAEKEWSESETTLRSAMQNSDVAGKKSEQENSEVTKQQTPEQKEKAKKEFIVQKIYTALVKEAKPQIAEILVKQEAQYEVDQLAKQLQMFNMKIEDFLARRQVSVEDFSAEMTASALGRLQLMFVLKHVTKDAKLEVTDADIEKAMAENADSEYVAQQKNNPEYLSYLRETISRQKVVDYLMSL